MAITAINPATNVPNAFMPAITPADPPASLEAKETITIALLNAIRSNDRLPIVSIDVCTSHMSSIFAIATTRNPSNVTIPVMSNTLPITSG